MAALEMAAAIFLSLILGMGLGAVGLLLWLASAFTRNL